MVAFDDDLLLAEVAFDLVDIAADNLGAVVEDAELLAHFLDMFHAVRAEDDRRAIFIKFLYGLFKYLHIDRVEAAEWFIQYDKIGLMDDRGDQLDLLLVYLGQFLYALVPVFRNFEPFEPLIESHIDVLLGHSLKLGEVTYLLFDFQFRVKSAFLRQIADAVRDVVIDGLLIVGDRTFRLFQKPKNHPECRRLARTVSTEETVHAAGGYSEIDIINCNIFTEFLGKLVQFK